MTHTRNDFSLRTYYADLSVSKETHQLIRNLPAFVTNDPAQFCHYYVEPNINSKPLKKPNIKNSSKYGTRSQKMLNLSKTANNSNNNEQIEQINVYETTMSMLKNVNPSIRPITEQTLVNTIKPFIDTRCDQILSERNNKHKDEISYFLMDNNGVFELDQGYHIKNVEQFHFAGDYGPNYQGSLFVDPYKYKIRQLEKQSNKNYNNSQKEQPKQKVCHGCRTKYFMHEWETHIKSEPHQRYLSDPAFIEFNEYIDALNKRLKKKDREMIDDEQHIITTTTTTNNRLPDIMEIEEKNTCDINRINNNNNNNNNRMNTNNKLCNEENDDTLKEINNDKNIQNGKGVIKREHMKKVNCNIDMENKENEIATAFKLINKLRNTNRKRDREKSECNDVGDEPQKKKRKVSDLIDDDTLIFGTKLKSVKYPKLKFKCAEHDFENDILILNEGLNGRLIQKKVRRKSSLVNLQVNYMCKKEKKKTKAKEEYFQRMRSNKKNRNCKKKTSLSCLNSIGFGAKIKNERNEKCCRRNKYESIPVGRGKKLITDVYVKCNKCHKIYCKE